MNKWQYSLQIVHHVLPNKTVFNILLKFWFVRFRILRKTLRKSFLVTCIRYTDLYPDRCHDKIICYRLITCYEFFKWFRISRKSRRNVSFVLHAENIKFKFVNYKSLASGFQINVVYWVIRCKFATHIVLLIHEKLGIIYYN